MIDFNSGGFFTRLKKVDDGEFEEMIKEFLIDGEEIVGTYYNTITHKLNGLCITDAYGAYATEAYDNFTINKNFFCLYQRL